MKHIYLVRHCKAAGQEADAPLTDQGREDSARLARFFQDKQIEVIISSPYTRAVETIRPFAESAGKRIYVDDRLKERVLSANDLDDWMSKLEQTFQHLDLKFEGGESSNEAMRRGIGVIEELLERPESRFVVVTHGALLSLMIKHYVSAFGFDDWKNMKNPDIFCLRRSRGEVQIAHLWESFNQSGNGV